MKSLAVVRSFDRSHFHFFSNILNEYEESEKKNAIEVQSSSKNKLSELGQIWSVSC